MSRANRNIIFDIRSFLNVVIKDLDISSTRYLVETFRYNGRELWTALEYAVLDCETASGPDIIRTAEVRKDALRAKIVQLLFDANPSKSGIKEYSMQVTNLYEVAWNACQSGLPETAELIFKLCADLNIFFTPRHHDRATGDVSQLLALDMYESLVNQYQYQYMTCNKKKRNIEQVEHEEVTTTDAKKKKEDEGDTEKDEVFPEYSLTKNCGLCGGTGSLGSSGGENACDDCVCGSCGSEKYYCNGCN